MSTPLDITGIGYLTGKKLVAQVIFPTGIVTLAGTTLSGGTVTGTTTIATGASVMYVGLLETVAGLGEYGVKSVISGTNLPDTTSEPYTRRVVEVASGTDMTSYAAITTAYASPVAVADTEEPLKLGGGFLHSGAWGANVTVSGTVSANVVQWSGTPSQLAADNTPLVSISANDAVHTAAASLNGMISAGAYTSGALVHAPTSGGTAIITNEQAIIQG